MEFKSWTNRPIVVLTGNDLTIEDIVAIGVGDKKVAIDAKALERCRHPGNI